MKTSVIKHNSALITSASVVALAATLHLGTSAYASTDYGPAVYRPMSGCSKWYTTGNGHKFVVIHDMEGYYASTISYLNNCNVSVSINYMVNGLKDTSTDYAAGEIDQQVREAYYAWHACCWNTWMFGTEHEGFASNPAWYTEAMYQASSGLQEHLCDTYSIAKDRNHIIGHNEHNNATWRSWMASNYPSINTLCNSHTDPGVYWDWSHFMSLINPPPPSGVKSGTRVKGDFNGDGKDDVVIAYDYGNATTKLWVFLSTGSAFSAPTAWYSSTTGGFDSTKAQYIAGDFNGDGKTDVAALYDYGSSNSKIWIWLSTGSGFAPAAVWWTSGVGSWDATRAKMIVGDFDGDGKTDIAMAYDYGNSTTHIWTWISTGTGFATPSVWWTSTTWDSSKATYLGGDFDGDGKKDIAGVYDYGNNTTRIWVFPSTGSAFTTALWWTSTTWDSSKVKYVSGDFNGDGKMDVAGAFDYGNNTTKIWVFPSSGSDLGTGLWWTSTTWNASAARYVAGDFNGDGKVDITSFFDYGGSTSKLWTFPSSGTAFPSSAIWWSSTTWAASKSTPF